MSEKPEMLDCPWSHEGQNFLIAVPKAFLAETRRAAASKALTDAAHQFATQDGLEALMFARDDIAAVRVTERWLLDRAAEYRREETE